jgi:hypothetical protein
MHDSFVVRRAQSIRDLQRVLRNFSLGQGCSSHTFAKRFAFQKFGDQVMQTVLCPYVENRQQIGMIHRAQHSCFLLESLQALRIIRQRFRQHFNCYHAIESHIPRAIHFSHTARAKLRHNLVRTQLHSRIQRHRCGIILLDCEPSRLWSSERSSVTLGCLRPS